MAQALPSLLQSERKRKINTQYFLLELPYNQPQTMSMFTSVVLANFNKSYMEESCISLQNLGSLVIHLNFGHPQKISKNRNNSNLTFCHSLIHSFILCIHQIPSVHRAPRPVPRCAQEEARLAWTWPSSGYAGHIHHLLAS